MQKTSTPPGPKKKKKPGRPLPLAIYIRRYGAPKKDHPRRAAYEKTDAFQRRSSAAKRGKKRAALERTVSFERHSAAAKKGWKKRKASSKLALLLADVLGEAAALEAGGDRKLLLRAYAKWQNLREDAGTAFPSRDYREILEQTAEDCDYGYDDAVEFADQYVED